MIMFNYSKKFLFVVFALCLFAMGAIIYSIIENGFKEGKDLIYQLLLIFSGTISSVILFYKLYVKPNNKESD